MGKTKNKNEALAGATTAIADRNSIPYTLKEGGLMVVAAIAASGAGAAIGKHSLAAGIPLTLYGVYRKNPYLIAAGLGLTLSNGFQKQGQSPSTTTEGMDGFKEIAEQAKERVGTFFQNFKEKLYLAPATPAPAPATTEGLGENEQVTYFLNPYAGTGELDMSAIDRVQEQIAEMTKKGNNLSDVDREF